MEFSDSLPGPITIYPHENWKGAYDLGSYDGQTLNAPCKVVGYRNGTHTEFQTWVPGPGETSSPPDTLYNCLKVDWPAPHLWLTNRKRDNDQIGAESWNGSLIDGMRDATGQMYMRNRYYDPASGRFTQEDPIGIAGGLNVYGFAGGDPVSYSDPYGLKGEDCRKVACPKTTRDVAALAAINRFARQLMAMSDRDGGREYGAYIVRDPSGRLSMVDVTRGVKGTVPNMPEAPANAIADIHTHPDEHLSGGLTIPFDFPSGVDAERTNHEHVYGVIVTPRLLLIIPIDRNTYVPYPRK
jgi:RHS repeat-associated protein